MKQKLFYSCLVGFLFLFQIGGWAQARSGQKERFTSEQRIEKQVEHVAQSLMLSDEVASQFIPVYSNYLKDFRSCAHIDLKAEFGDGKFKKENLTDEQIDKIIQLRFVKCRKILDVREKYYYEFKKILTPRQIMNLYAIERNLSKKVQGEMNRRFKKEGK